MSIDQDASRPTLHARSGPPTGSEWLDRAIALADGNVADGGGPFGAVIVRDGVLIAEGVNQVTRIPDPSAHAEIAAIRAACRALGNFDLSGVMLYSSCEPCPMCLSAALWARISEVVFAADRYAAAYAGFDDSFFYDLFERPRESWPLKIRHQSHARAAAPFATWTGTAERIEY